MAEIGEVNLTNDGNYRATIKNYSKFKFPVSIHRANGEYYEEKPFFQQGVRRSTEKIYEDILTASQADTMSVEKTKRGHRTLTSLRIGNTSNRIVYDGRQYVVVTGKKGYYLQSPDSIYYELKLVPNFDDWCYGKLRVMKSPDKDSYLIMHDYRQVGILTPIANGMRFHDLETGIDINVNM